MYRTADPRFRRRLNEIENTLERANESAQSSIYIFGQNYVKPCFEAISLSATSCFEASCLCLESQRNRPRRQRGRSRASSRPELNFDFYDDWENDESDALLGWNDEEYDQLGDSTIGYGAASNTQPARNKGMHYPRVGRRAATVSHEGAVEPTMGRGPSLFGKLFGAKSVAYIPSAAGLQDHPGASRRDRRDGDTPADILNTVPEGIENYQRHRGRKRSDTTSSGHTTDSYSSRGDIFPSDEEDDAIPLDDEFAMVLERRGTQTGDISGNETEVQSTNSAGSPSFQKRSKRPTMGRAQSGRRTASARSTRSSENGSSRRSSYRIISQNDGTTPGKDQLPRLTDPKSDSKNPIVEEESNLGIATQSSTGLNVQLHTITKGTIIRAMPETLHDNVPDVPSAIPFDEQQLRQLPTPSATDDEEEKEDRVTSLHPTKGVNRTNPPDKHI